MLPVDLPDPRRFPVQPASPAAGALHAQVIARLAERASATAELADAAIDATLTAWLDPADGLALENAMQSSPSAAVYRHLWRRLTAVEMVATRTPAFAVALFAVPLVVVTGREGGAPNVVTFHATATPSTAHAELPGRLAAPDALAALLREHGALGGNARFALSASLTAAEALELRELPHWLSEARAMSSGAIAAPVDVTAVPIAVTGATESVHLRFVLGCSLFGPHVDPFQTADVGRWGMSASRLVSQALAQPGVTVLAMPRAPQRLVPALAAGRAAQRDVALQLFAGNALRKLRASVGEAIGVISAHQAPDAVAGGELRLSLSSPLEARDAEGFRYPLQMHERVPDAVASIIELLRDLRVADIRTMPGVQTDRDGATGLHRFCRPEEIPAAGALH
jgi:hypothetical protein